MQIGFIGLGKLGLPCAEVIAKKGHNVLGYDISKVESSSVTIASTVKECVMDRDIVFIAVPTPHDPDYDGSTPSSHLPSKDFDYSTVQRVLSEANEHMNKNQLLVLISTVLPGTTRTKFIDLVDNTRFVYNPYLIAMGSVEWDMVNPEMAIIGTEHGTENGDAKQLVDFYKTVMDNDPRYVIGTWDECECIKVFYNTVISTKIGLVNMIQDVAVKQGNIDVDVVTTALAESSMRIMSKQYMTAGMGDGGGCVLPDFKVTVNGQSITMRDLYEKFNSSNVYIVDSADFSISSRDEKKIDQVTCRDYSGELVVFETDAGVVKCTPEHLLPVLRGGKLLLIRADEVFDTDLFFLV